MSERLTRREFLKTGTIVLVALPFAGLAGRASAITNSTLRAQLHYQNFPKNGMNCATCLEFIPVAGNKESGRCKVIADDDEISVNGYCTKWNTM